MSDGEWYNIEEAARERLRDGYRFCWNLPYTREVLAGTSNLMLCSDKDVLDNFTLSLDLSQGVGGRVVSTLLRLCRQVYREYQRALWDDENIDVIHEKEKVMVEKLTTVFEARRRRLGREEALMKAEKKMLELRSNQFVDEGVLEIASDRVMEFKYEVTEAKSAEAIAASDVDTDNVMESSYHVYGDIGVLLLDTRWSRIAADGTQDMAAPLISNDTFLKIEAMIEGNVPVRALVVATECPVVELSKEETIAVRCGGVHNYTDFHECNSTFALNPAVQERLLDMIFEWKKRERWRQVLLLSGGIGYGMDTVVRIKDTNWAIQQLTCGPLTDYCKDVRSNRVGTLEGIKDGKYTYEHDFLEHQRNYGECIVRASFNEDSVIHAQLVGQYFARVGCITGPIIGKVTDASAIILVEVDNQAPVTCLVADVLSGAVLRSTKLLPPRRPFAFVFDGLEANRHYVVRFEGFVNANDFMGSFTTGSNFVAKDESGKMSLSSNYSLNLVFMSGEQGSGGASPGEGEATEKPIWNLLSESTAHPWSGVDAIIHLGGQVEMGPAVSAAVALLARAEREEEGSLQYKDLVDQALDHLREAYRTSWSLPGTREALANGSHIMLRGGMDFGTMLLGRKGGTGTGSVKLGGSSRRTLRALVKQVYREYQRQLWDPEGVADGPSAGCSDSDGNGEWHFHCWGPVGVFCLDVKETKLWKGRGGEKDSESSLISEAQWRCFSEAMHDGKIQTLIICCELPFVDDSIGDARYKSTDPAFAHLVDGWPYHGSELLRLLNGLFEWKGLGNGKEVQFICGGISVGVDSLLKHEVSGVDIRQLITGPAASVPESDLWAERTGVLDESITYEHGPVTTKHNCVLLQATGDSTGGVEVHSSIVTSSDFLSQIGGSGGLIRRPAFLPQLHILAGAGGGAPPEGQNVLLLNGGSEEEVEEQRFKLNSILLRNVMQREDVVGTLKIAFKSMNSGDFDGADNPVDFAKKCVKVLVRWYYLSPAAVRDVALPPNQYLLEVVAGLWEKGEVGAKPREKEAAGGKKDDVKLGFEAVAAVKKGEGRNVPLVLLNETAWVDFCREAFLNALVVRMNLFLKASADKMR
jgi:hypothetical protein